MFYAVAVRIAARAAVYTVAVPIAARDASATRIMEPCKVEVEQEYCHRSSTGSGRFAIDREVQYIELVF